MAGEGPAAAIPGGALDLMAVMYVTSHTFSGSLLGF